MTRGQRHILITGPPRVGKTTLVRRIAEDIARLGPVRFYTAEILERGARTSSCWNSPPGTALR